MADLQKTQIQLLLHNSHPPTTLKTQQAERRRGSSTKNPDLETRDVEASGVHDRWKHTPCLNWRETLPEGLASNLDVTCWKWLLDRVKERLDADVNVRPNLRLSALSKRCRLWSKPHLPANPLHEHLHKPTNHGGQRNTRSSRSSRSAKLYRCPAIRDSMLVTPHISASLTNSIAAVMLSSGVNSPKTTRPRYSHCDNI